MTLADLALPFCGILVLLPPGKFLTQLILRLVRRMVRIEIGVRVPDRDKLAVPALEAADLGIVRQAGSRDRRR